MSIPPIVIKDENGQDQRIDNIPNITEREYAIMQRAALIQQKKALQDQVRGLTMQISAIEKKYGIGDVKTGSGG